MVTLSGYVLVFAVLALLWRIGRTTAYAAVIAVSMYLSLVGSGKVLPFMGVMPVAGGSIYFPFVLLALAFAHRQFGNVASLNIIYGGLLGLVFVSLGYIRWYMFGVVDSDPDYAYETYMMLHEAAANARDAMLAIPDRMAAELAGTTEPFVVHKKLMEEIRNAISEVIAKVEAGPPADE